jgi:hypothetical protein
MKLCKRKSVYAFGGDALTSPEHTEISFLAALGGGAEGILSGVRLSKDGVVVCTNYDTFEKTCGDKRAVRNMNWNEINQLDAGFTFRSTKLNKDNQPSGILGKDKPWEGNLPKKRAIRIQSLEQALILFSRRCAMMLKFPSNQNDLVDATIETLKRYGVLNRVKLLGEESVCKYLAKKYPDCQRVLIGLISSNPSEQLQLAEKLGASNLYLDWNDACHTEKKNIVFNKELKKKLVKSKISLFLGSNTMYYSPKPEYFNAIKDIEGIDGIIAKGTLPTVEGLTPSALIAQDKFAGEHINKNLWAAGYSHINRDTVILQDNGLHINIKNGGSYSGAAAVCLIPIHARFDAHVDFSVETPQQGTTFEMAAICIDPGYMHMNNSDLNTRNVNLTFDVHGAPPYASSERDENDGFRCGWNNGFNLTKVAPDWEASSVNMYNKYGRDVGNGEDDNPNGTLRLVRNGSIFTTYYKDKYNESWVCSGAMLVQNMTDDVYVRLAAKHWNKGGNPAPGNVIQFYNFKLYQFED